MAKSTKIPKKGKTAITPDKLRKLPKPPKVPKDSPKDMQPAVVVPVPIEWNERIVSVKDLKPYERNPRRISKEAYALLVKSLKENGYHQRILATQDLRIIGGHQRIMALKECGYKTVKVLVPDVQLSEDDYKRLLIQDNLPFGEFDFDILSADFEPAQLIEWGMPEDWLPNFDPVGEDEQGKLDEASAGDPVKCPKCGYEFDPNDSEN